MMLRLIVDSNIGWDWMIPLMLIAIWIKGILVRKNYLPSSSTSFNIKPPMCQSPLARSLFSILRSVTKILSSQEPSLSRPCVNIVFLVIKSKRSKAAETNRTFDELFGIFSKTKNKFLVWWGKWFQRFCAFNDAEWMNEWTNHFDFPLMLRHWVLFLRQIRKKV